MNQERQSVESPLTNAMRLPAISLPVAERQGYHQFLTARCPTDSFRCAFAREASFLADSLRFPSLS